MRTYGDGCGIAHALDIVGERWALLVVRELLLGPKRFVDLRGGLPGASTNVLSQRLRQLEQAAIVQRRKLPPPGGLLGLRAHGLGPRAQADAARRSAPGRRARPSFPENAPVGTDSVVLALGTFFDAGAAGDLVARYELRLGDSTFRVHIADGAIEVDRGAAEHPDAIVESDPNTFSAVVWNDRDLAEAQRAGALTIEGDPRAVERLLGLFPKPERIATP